MVNVINARAASAREQGVNVINARAASAREQGFLYAYNSLSLMAQKTIQTDKVFTYFYTYDSKGNLDEYTYPSGFVTKNTYSATNGSLVSVIDKATGTTIYAPGNTNARGQLTDYVNAGGTLCTTLQYDIYGLPTFVQTGWAAGGIALQNLETQFDPQTGNLNYRKDKKIQVNGSDLTETFTYDPVHKNRLATWQVTGQPQFTMTYADNNGNILTKSDITSAGNPYIYTDENNLLTKPHAVKSINAPLLIPAEPQQSITYNRFNKVQQLTHTKQGLRLEIMYGPDEQRVKSDFYVNNVLAKTRYFVGGDYEVEVLPDGSERRLHYLPGGGLYVCDKNNVKIGMYYVLTDYQGNWYKVVTETGSLVEQYSFDAWGKRRNASNWSYTGVPATFTFDRGYTGHEMLDAFGLINMNGRVYDPVIARFLSPDNYVQAPDNSQGFNRYSYCINNPLTYKDPSGNYFLIDDFVIGFFKGLVSGRNPLKEGWNQAADCAKIYGGLFAADTKQPGWGWQILSRFTWQLPQTVLGLAFSQTANTFGNIERVDYKAGATVLKSRYHNLFYGLGGQGITMGSYIIGSNQISADPNNWLFQHEYGHYLQSRASGWAFLQRYAIPSLFSRGDYDPSNIFDPHYTDYNPVEQDANARSVQYFHKREGNDFVWHFEYNPIGFPGRGWHRNLDQFDTPEFQSLLQRLTIRPNFGDYYSWVLPIIGPIIDGLVNTHNYNQRYINSE